MKLLLISNSGQPPYVHCCDAMAQFVGPNAVVGFVPAADLADEQSYVARVREVLVATGVAQRVEHLDWQGNWHGTLGNVEAVLVGGGNTYVLLQRMMSSGLGSAIRDSVRGGLPYLGASAGANIAGSNILTTNDWNVTGSTVFTALGLVPFNINPHYASNSAEAPTGETRDERIREYRLMNRNPVLAIEEGTFVEVSDGLVRVGGRGLVRAFLSDGSDRWVQPGKALAISDL